MHYSGTELIDPFKVLEWAGLQSGWHVADLGCGSLGHFVFPAAQMVGGSGRVYAVDIQKIVLQTIERIAKQNQHWNVIPVWSDIDVPHAAQIPSGSLDLTLLANNLFFSSNRAGFAEEATRLTKPGGCVIVIEWQKEQTPIGPAIEHRLDMDESRTVFARPELRLLGSFDAGDHHYALLFERESSSDGGVRVVSHSPPVFLTGSSMRVT